MPQLVQFNMGILDKNQNLNKNVEFFISKESSISDAIIEEFNIKRECPASLPYFSDNKFIAYTAAIADWKALEKLFNYFRAQIPVYYHFANDIREVKTFAVFEYAVKSENAIWWVEKLYSDVIKNLMNQSAYLHPYIVLNTKTPKDNALESLEIEIKKLRVQQLEGLAELLETQRKANYCPSKFFPWPTTDTSSINPNPISENVLRN